MFRSKSFLKTITGLVLTLALFFAATSEAIGYSGNEGAYIASAISSSAGEWSAWSTTPITPNDRLEVEIRTRQEPIYKTVYNYYRYTYQYNSTTWWTYSSNPGQWTGIRLETRQTGTKGTYKSTYSGYVGYTLSGASGIWWQVDCGHRSAPGGSFETQVADGSITITEYRSRPIYIVSSYTVSVIVNDAASGIALANLTGAAQGDTVSLSASPYDGYRFVRWEVLSGDITISNATSQNAAFTMPSANVAILAIFERIPAARYTVTFCDWDGSILKTESVEAGSSATAPPAPYRASYEFTGWDKSFTNITANTTVTAQYQIKAPDRNIFNPAEEGYSFSNSSADLGFPRGYKTPLSLWIDVYGNAVGRMYYDQLGQDEWGGSCFGFSVTTTKFYNGNLNTRSYGGATTYSISAPRSSTHALTQLIEKAHISWWLDGVPYVTFSNNSLISATENFANTGKNPIIMYIDATAGRYQYCHAVVPWKVERIGSDTRIYIYDCNQPGNEDVYFTIYGIGGYSCNYTYAGNTIDISRLGFIWLKQVLDGEAKSTYGRMLVSVDSKSAEILTASGMSVEALSDADKVEPMPSQSPDSSYTEFTAYWLPVGMYTVIAYTNEPVSVMVSSAGNAYTVNLAPQHQIIEVDIGRTLEIAGAAHGNITEYNDDGSELLLPITPETSMDFIPGSNTDTVEFSDVSSGVWFESAVTSVATVGIVEGVGSNRFNPHGRLTVAHLVTMLMRTQYGRITGGNSWYAPYVDQALRDGILFASDNLDPNGEITRSQAALIFTRYIERFNPRWAKTRISGAPGDILSVPGQYRSAVEKAYAWNLVHGDDRNMFNPQNTLTRAEAAQILYNYYRIVD